MKQPVSDNEIRARAYKLWEDEGRPEGREREHWAEALRQFESETSGASEDKVAYAGISFQQTDPAEGDRQRVERELARQKKAGSGGKEGSSE